MADAVRNRAAVFRLYPTAEQAEQLAQIAGACRFVYNLALEQRRDWWHQYRNNTGHPISFFSQSAELKQLRAEVDWIRFAPADALKLALRDLNQAYQAFFAGRAGYPTTRKRGVNDSFRFQKLGARNIERTGRSSALIQVPRVGMVKLRGWRELPGTPLTATISLRAGQWFASVQCEISASAPSAPPLSSVGIDLGVSVFAALSDGTSIAPANHGKGALAALRRAQRDLARKRRGSANRKKAVRRVARIHMRVTNARKDFLHKTSTTIAKNHGTVVVEALKVRNMTASAAGTIEAPGRNVRQKTGLNRAILDQGWGQFRTMLAYKLADRGGRLIEVSAAYTSQTCSTCGCVSAANRRSQSAFVCVGCGHVANADTNAAINILRRADSALQPVEGHRSTRPVEAGTGQSSVA